MREYMQNCREKEEFTSRIKIGIGLYFYALGENHVKNFHTLLPIK